MRMVRKKPKWNATKNKNAVADLTSIVKQGVFLHIAFYNDSVKITEVVET